MKNITYIISTITMLTLSALAQPDPNNTNTWGNATNVPFAGKTNQFNTARFKFNTPASNNYFAVGVNPVTPEGPFTEFTNCIGGTILMITNEHPNYHARVIGNVAWSSNYIGSQIYFYKTNGVVSWWYPSSPTNTITATDLGGHRTVSYAGAWGDNSTGSNSVTVIKLHGTNPSPAYIFGVITNLRPAHLEPLLLQGVNP